MKKTIIAIMALAGVASADTLIDLGFDLGLSDSCVYTDYNNGTTNEEASFIASELVGYGSAIDFDKSGAITLSGDAYKSIVTGANGSDFSIVTTVKFDSWAEYTSGGSVENRLFICGSGSENTHGIGWTVANGVMGITTKGKAHNPITLAAGTPALKLDTWYTLALTYDAETGSALFYTNGELVGSLALKSAAVATPDGNFTVGGGRTGASQALWDGAMADFKLYDTTLSADQVAAFGAPVQIPEPTTATLSLLALAGLAARRRRR